jgi:hypothetical protein
MTVHLKIIGSILIFLAICHIVFPRYFGWGKELLTISLINRQMMYVHTFFIALTIFLMGIFCIYGSSDIVNTSVGKQLALGFSIFWGLRLIFQFFVYSPKLWKGKIFETTIHILFSVLWTYFTTVFLMIYLYQ